MKRVLPALLSLLLLAGMAPARDFAAAVPDDTFLVLQVNQVAELRERLKASPLGKAYESVRWMELFQSFAGMGDGEDGEEAPEVDAEDFKQAEERIAALKPHFTGTFAFVAGDFTETATLFAQHKKDRAAIMAASDGDEEPGEEEALRLSILEEAMDAKEGGSIASEFRIYAEVSRGGDLLALLESWAHEDLREEDEDAEPQEFKKLDLGKVQAFAILPKPDEDADEEEKARLASEAGAFWALSDEVFVFAFTEKGLRAALAGLEREPDNRLSRSQTYRDALAGLGEHDTLLYLNLSRLDAWLRAGLVDPAAPPAVAANPMMQMPAPAKIIDWLALDALEPYVLGTRLVQDGLSLRGRFGFTRETALSRILIDPTETPAPQPDFVHKNLQQVSTGHWRFARAYDEIEKSLMGLAPQAAVGLGFGRAMATGQLGIDPKTQFLDHFGSGFVFSQEIDADVLTRMLDVAEEDPEALQDFTRQHPTQGRSFLIGLQMTNRDAVAGALNTLLAKLHPQGLPEAERFMGQDIHFPLKGLSAENPMENQVAYSFFDDYLVVAVGKSKLIHDAIQAKQDKTLRLWEDGNFLTARRRMPAEAQMLEYSSGKQMEGALKVMQRSFGMMMKGENKGRFPDLSAFANLLRDTIGTNLRKGLRFEMEGFMAFGESP